MLHTSWLSLSASESSAPSGPACSCPGCGCRSGPPAMRNHIRISQQANNAYRIPSHIISSVQWLCSFASPYINQLVTCTGKKSFNTFALDTILVSLLACATAVPCSSSY